ncbi:MAG: winged helix DNA-binding protein [Dehalococcoidia bacterium]|nr:winged helix DNA-binding protein [Dehalococcoidia bacterium]
MYDYRFTESALETWALIRQVWALMNRLALNRLLKTGITPEKVAVLWAARDYPGALTPAELSRLVFRENQTTAGLLNRMEHEGLVKRLPKRKGRPYTRIELTPKGEQICEPCVDILKNLILTLPADIPEPEQKQICNILLKIRDSALAERYQEIVPLPDNLPKTISIIPSGHTGRGPKAL